MEIPFSASEMQAAEFHAPLHFYERNPPHTDLHINMHFEDEPGP